MPKVKVGDIFEINTPKGKAYVHFMHQDPKIKRQLIRVLQGLYLETPNVDELVGIKERYMIFFLYLQHTVEK